MNKLNRIFGRIRNLIARPPITQRPLPIPSLDPLEPRRLLSGVVVFSVANTSSYEGNGGQTTFSATFTVSLNGPTTTPISVDWYTSDNTAKAGINYTAARGALAFATGATSRTFSVSLIGNTTPQPTRTFFVQLTNAQGAPIGRDRAIAQILDDDPPTVTLLAPTPTAIESSATAGVFRFTRTGPADTPLRIFYSIQGSAENILDYSRIEKSILIPAGRESADLSIKPVQDNINHDPKTVTLQIKRRPEYKGGKTYSATVTILPGDSVAPTAKLSAPTLTKPSSPFYQFTVKYTDDQKMDLASVSDADLQVTGPDKYSPLAQLVTKSLSRNLKTVTAIYQVPTPSANGVYTVKSLANQVKDSFANPLAAATLGTFQVSIA